MAMLRLTAKSPRPAIESEIERLIELLDALDPDADLEDNGDLEPSIGVFFNGQVDLEDDRADEEPSLGSLDRAIDQRRWNGPDGVNAGVDLELQDYRSEPRALGIRSSELMRRERSEVTRVDWQLAAIVSRRARAKAAAKRVARRAAQ